MDTDGFLRDPLSRRRLFASTGIGLAGGSATLVAACGGADKPTGSDAKTRDQSDAADVEILNGVLDLELMGIAAYKAAAGSLAGHELTIVKGFLEQEQEHVDVLTLAIRDAAGTPNRAKSRYDFPRMSSQRDALRFAVSLENTAVAAYIDALPKLTRNELRGTASAIVTTEAEHVSVLLGALGEPPVPHAFATGEPS